MPITAKVELNAGGEGNKSMDAFWIMDHLDTRPQPSLKWYDEAFAFFFTPVGKELLGIEGWDETGYIVDGRGKLIRDAQHSTDGYWTADVEIIFFRIWSDNRRPSSTFGLRLGPAGLHMPPVKRTRGSRPVK
jgi:hypothetical protein